MTREEIVRALRGCAVYHGVLCKEMGCELVDKGAGVCRDILEFTAAELIERLEKEKAALLERVKIFEGCDTCKNYNPMCCAEECGACDKKCPCASCTFGSNWEWKGVDEE